MADGKKKRSLREAFGVVRAPGEPGAAEPTPDGNIATGPVGAPEGGKPAPAGEEKPEKKPSTRKKGRASSNGDGSSGGDRARGRNAGKKDASGDAVITGNGVGKRSGGRGRAASGNGGREEAAEMVPGKGGKMVPAHAPVNMTFTVTAKERYLWTLELKRRGLTAVGVLRETMEGMVGEDHDG